MNILPHPDKKGRYDNFRQPQDIAGIRPGGADVKSITYNPTAFRIEVQFPYTVGLHQAMKNIPDAQWDARNKCWHFPTARAADLIALGSDAGFQIDPALMSMIGRKRHRDSSIREKLYPFQREGVDFLHKAQGRAILADEMGLGKTVQALVFWAEIGFKRLLVVCPASVAFKWKAEIEKWTGKTAEVVTNGKMLLPKSDALIISYTLMTKRINELYDAFPVVIFDECHALATSKAQRTNAAKTFTSPSVIGLSGTPFLNRPIEMFEFLNMLYPSTYKSYFQFGIRYCDGHQEMVAYRRGEPLRVWKFDGLTNVDELRRRLDNVLFRRTKKEVLNQLPDISRVKLPVVPTNMSEYRSMVAEIRNKIRSGESNSLELVTRLRRISGLGKVEAAVELAQDLLNDPEKKVVIYAHHKDVVYELETNLTDYGVVKIVGDISQENRDIARSKFQTGKPRVMIISSAGGEGIDLYRASDIIFAEREWNPGREEQAESRLHRIGQKNSVTSYYLVAKGTIDEKIDNLITTKRGVFGAVIKTEDIVELILGEINEI